jgi:CDP-paratose 2-epimerase
MNGRGKGPVLVTGGAGFIGSNLADRLASENHDVIVFDALTRAGVEENLEWLRERHPGRITSVLADVRDADAVEAAAANAKAVFHLAAQVAVTTSLVDPRDDFETNVRGTLNLLEALRRRGDRTPLIFASTNKVYGDLADIPLESIDDAYLPQDARLRASGVAEDRPLDFHTPYGCSKGAADQYVLDYARSFGVPTCVMRMSCIYGPRQMGTEDQGWVAHFLIRALLGQPISVYGDGRQVRDILNVADAVAAYLAAWRRIDAVQGRAFNLGGGADNAVSLRRLIAHIEDLVGHRVETAFSDWRAGDQRYFVADTTAARRSLRLATPLDWRTGVAELAHWLRTACSRRRPLARPRPRPRAVPSARGAAAPPPQLYAPLRLLMTTDAVGGVWTYALDLAGALASHGVRTTLAVLGPPPGRAEVAEAEAIPSLELIETGLPLDWTAKEAAEVSGAGAALADLARRCRADLIHLNSPALAAGTRFPGPVVGVCHSCLATWWAAVRGGAMPEDFRWRAAANRQGLVACDALVAPSAAFADATARAYELPRPLTVHNGRRQPGPAAGRRERQVFTAGRLWDAGKNVAALEAAAALIDAPLHAAGPLDGPNGTRTTLRNAQALGALSSRDVRAWLARTPVFASVALYEPFGLAVLEAAQAGCALLLADIPTFRELWHDAAVFVAPDDPDAIAAALQALLDAPDHAAALGAAARARAGHYTLDAAAEGMMGVYGVLLASRLPRRKAVAAA